MDLKKIFIKDASPTKVGGQAVMEGLMMRGKTKNATVIRLPDETLHIKVDKNPERKKWSKIPVLRGVYAFGSAMVMGTRTLTYSANILEKYDGSDESVKASSLEKWLTKKFGEKAIWNAMIYLSVIVAVLFTVGVFIVGPTAAVNWMKKITDNHVVLNLMEGFLRIVLFILYVLAISKMREIKRLFQYHGAEHKCIHCYESKKPLTVENCREFYTLHPRCGTSFLMFVMVISLILFSLLGWPNLLFRILSRILLIPVVAGLSFELLQWAGRSDNGIVKILSIPGLLLQKITTKEPDDSQLEVAIVAMNAVISEEEEFVEGRCDKEGKLILEDAK